MEKELAGYRKSLKMQNAAYIAAALVITLFIVLSFMKVITPVATSERWASFWNGFIGGISMAAVAITLIGLILNLRALQNEQALKRLYIKEHDERAREIAHKAGHLSYWFEVMGLGLAAIIGGYFNPLIFIVCLAALLYICLIRLGLKLYYNQKL